MDAAYGMVRDTRTCRQLREADDDGSEVLPCPAGELPAVEAQWGALAATCDGMTAGDAVLMLELARCLADLEGRGGKSRRAVSSS